MVPGSWPARIDEVLTCEWASAQTIVECLEMIGIRFDGIKMTPQVLIYQYLLRHTTAGRYDWELRREGRNYWFRKRAIVGATQGDYE